MRADPARAGPRRRGRARRRSRPTRPRRRSPWLRARRARWPRSRPTLPNPWTTQRCSASGQPRRSQARSVTMTTPAPVASCRKTEPPMATGLPVTISGTAWPTCIEYVSIIQAIVCSLVAMSGAGMSCCGPMNGSSSEVKRRVRRIELGGRHVMRATADAALGAAVGQPQERALPRHPHRQGGALPERDLVVVADPALRGPERARVLDPVRRIDGSRLVVEHHRDAEHHRLLGVAKPQADRLVDVRVQEGLLELGDSRAEERRVPLELAGRVLLDPGHVEESSAGNVRFPWTARRARRPM